MGCNLSFHLRTGCHHEWNIAAQTNPLSKVPGQITNCTTPTMLLFPAPFHRIITLYRTARINFTPPAKVTTFFSITLTYIHTVACGGHKKLYSNSNS